MQEKIDFVLTWVDPSDQAWIEERSKFDNNDHEASGEVRYRDWGLLKYWFRAVEKYCPWVNAIYFVTCGQIPDWLDTSHEKLILIKHADYIPGQYLPTFNSNVIELLLHNITSLSEHFVYFNDDTFVMSQVEPSDFFVDGMPVDTFALNAISAKANNSMIEHISLNNMEIIAKYYDKKEVQRKQFKKLFNIANGAKIVKTVLLWPWKNFTGIDDPHMPMPYLKSTLNTLWELEEKTLEKTLKSRFRSRADYSLWLARYWDLLSGNFVNGSRKYDKYFVLEDGCNSEQVLGQKIRLLCLNDSEIISDFSALKEEVGSVFLHRFPTKSLFEK